MELTQAQYDELTEKISMLTFKQQETNDILEGGIRSANLKEYRNTYVINAQDSLDASYPFLVHFNIISEMVKIISIKLSFWLLPFRAYSKAGVAQGTPSGGGATSGSGGGQTSSYVATPSGGGATSGSKTTPSGGGSTTGYKGSASGGGDTTGYKGTPSGGGKTSLAASGTLYHVLLGDDNYIAPHEGGYYLSSYPGYITTVNNNHTHTVANHTHPSHYHTTPDHTHPNHYHSTPNHTHPSHTHTTPNHTHPTHAHTVANHTHSTPNHTHPNHTHSAVYGIFEEETSPTIVPSISRDNGLTWSLPLGSFTKDQQLDITRFIDTAGDKMIKFESTTRARLSVQIEIKLDIKAR